jgi:hypothetical protein
LPCSISAKAPLDVVDGHREIGIDVHPCQAARLQHAMAHGRTLAAIALEGQDGRVEQAHVGQHLLGRLRGAIGGAVVDEHDLELGPVERRPGEGRQGRADAGRLVVHRDDQRARRDRGC